MVVVAAAPALVINIVVVVVVGAPAISLYRRRVVLEVVVVVWRLPLLDNLIRAVLLWRRLLECLGGSLARPVLCCAVLCLPVARFIYVNLSPPLSAPAQVAVYVVESRSILLIQVVNLNLFRLHVGLNFFPLSRSLSPSFSD